MAEAKKGQQSYISQKVLFNKYNFKKPIRTENN